MAKIRPVLCWFYYKHPQIIPPGSSIRENTVLFVSQDIFLLSNIKYPAEKWKFFLNFHEIIVHVHVIVYTTNFFYIFDCPDGYGVGGGVNKQSKTNEKTL